MSRKPSWPTVDSHLQALLDLPPEERPRRLEQYFASDPDLHKELAELVAADRVAHALRWTANAGTDALDPSLRKVGPYRILETLGRGGMGTVVLALRDDDAFHKLVAVKIAHLGLRGDARLWRFRQERQILASLDHPGIARILDGGTLGEGSGNGVPYLVMELVEGETVTDHCHRYGLGLEKRIALFLEICEAVSYAHRNLIVHRDLKPANILVTAEGRPKLLDFGIAKLLTPEAGTAEEASSRTFTHDRVLTPHYASPEQIRGETVDTTCDVYALGVLLCELLAGATPYATLTTSEQVIQAVLEERPAPLPSSLATPPELSRRLCGDLDAVILKALRKDSRDRYGSVAELAQDLRNHLAGNTVAARRGSGWYRAGKLLRRHRWGAAAAAALLMVLSVFAITASVQARAIARERDEVDLERQRAELQLRKAEEVSELLVQLFQEASPEQAQGIDLTAQELLRRGIERVRRDLQDQPAVRGTMLRTLGGVYRRLGNYEAAEPLLEEALQLHRKHGGESQIQIAHDLTELGLLALLRGDFTGAETAHQAAFDLLQREAEDHPVDLALSLQNLGTVAQEKGDLTTAEPLLRQALDLLENHLETFDTRIASAAGALAEVLRMKGDFTAAEAIFRRALEVQRKILASQHPDLALTLNNLGLAVSRQGRFEEASAFLEEAVAIADTSLGTAHPSYAVYLGNAAGVLIANGEARRAEPLARRALDLRRAQSGGQATVCGGLLDVGHALRLQGRHKEAQPLYEEARDVCTKALGADHLHSGHPHLWLGRNALEMGDVAMAEQGFRRALKIWSKLPEGHLFPARARGGLGACLTVRGQPGEGELLLAPALQTLVSVEGEKAGFTRWIRHHLEIARTQQGAEMEASSNSRKKTESPDSQGGEPTVEAFVAGPLSKYAEPSTG